MQKRCSRFFCATAGILYMTMLTAQPVFAEDVATGGENIWSRFSTIMQDVYGELVAIQHNRSRYSGIYRTDYPYGFAESAGC